MTGSTAIAERLVAAAPAPIRRQPGIADPTRETRAGATDVDIFWPERRARAPGDCGPRFTRRRRNMAGWGQHLAQEGFVAAVPDLPAWSDHARNGRFIADLCAYLCAGESWRQRIDPARVGLMGSLPAG